MSDPIDSEPEGNEFRLSKRALLTLGLGACAVPVSHLLAQAAGAGAGPGVPGAPGAGAPRPPMPKVTPENIDAVLNRRFASANFCSVATQTVEGPYFIDNRIMRSDIREKQAGEKVTLKLQILDANVGCEPLPNALVSVWQANAMGYYSGYPNVNPDLFQPAGTVRMRGHAPETGDERWLRGVLMSDPEGWVTFTTIVPGWYTMRAPHIHVRVIVKEREMATTQFYFPQALLNNVFTRPPYAKRGPGVITNENDTIRRQSNAAPWSMLEISQDSDGSLIGTGKIGLAHA